MFPPSLDNTQLEAQQIKHDWNILLTLSSGIMKAGVTIQSGYPASVLSHRSHLICWIQSKIRLPVALVINMQIKMCKATAIINVSVLLTKSHARPFIIHPEQWFMIWISYDEKQIWIAWLVRLWDDHPDPRLYKLKENQSSSAGLQGQRSEVNFSCSNELPNINSVVLKIERVLFGVLHHEVQW